MFLRSEDDAERYEPSCIRRPGNEEDTLENHHSAASAFLRSRFVRQMRKERTACWQASRFAVIRLMLPQARMSLGRGEHVKRGTQGLQ